MKISEAKREYLVEIEVRRFTPKTIRCYRNNLNLFLRFCEEEAHIMKNYIIVGKDKHIPEYYPTMYLDGYSPMEILQSAHRKIYADHRKRTDIPEVNITTEVKLK